MEKTSNNSKILVKINGNDENIPQGITIIELLKLYKINSERVVIELNKEILPKGSFEDKPLKNNDELEIVTFVGGG